MSILFSEGSSSFILPLKLILISASVLSAAVALKLSVPAITNFAVSEVPSIYNGVVAWLRPPYLYLVVNCIIITIVASSKLQTKLDDVELSPSPAPLLQTTAVHDYHHQHVQFPPLEPIKQHSFESVVLSNEVVEPEALTPEFFEHDNCITNNLNCYDGKVLATENAADASSEAEMNSYKEEFVTSKSSWSPSPITRVDSLECPLSNEKPPVSARFGHRRAVKASPEGGKAALGVSKPKRQDTLESTWKTITEGRAMLLTRHLRKSDKWETHGGRHNQNLAPQNPKMVKSDTFSDRSRSSSDNNNSPLLSPSLGSGKLKREPSLSQDELNRRVEAFIKKFNEEMRLQRQESLNQFREMINRGANK